jgi:hypothetical protein
MLDLHFQSLPSGSCQVRQRNSVSGDMNMLENCQNEINEIKSEKAKG